MKHKKTFRLEEKTISELEEYAKQNNISQTEAIESAIHCAIQNAIHVPYACHTQQSDENDVWKELFLKEHEKLLELTDKVAESLHASQTLQALDKPSSSIKTLNNQTDQEELLTQPKPKSRWQRLKDAW